MTGLVWNTTVTKACAARLVADLAEREIYLDMIRTRSCCLDIQKNSSEIEGDPVKEKHTMPSEVEAEHMSSRFVVAPR